MALRIKLKRKKLKGKYIGMENVQNINPNLGIVKVKKRMFGMRR
jgi:hypothetical protein